MTKRFLMLMVALVWLDLGTCVFAASPEVSVSIDRETVTLGDSVRLSLTVRGNTPASPPTLPPIPNFDVHYVGVRRESFSSVTIVIQGKKVENRQSGGGTTFEYDLTPQRAGTLTLPQFVFTLGGQRYKTHQPYVIQVVEAAAPSESGDVFTKVSTKQNEVYLGERVLLTIEIFFDRDITDYELKVPWYRSIKDFLMEDLERNPNATYLPLVVNGQDQVIAEKTDQMLHGRRYTVLKFQKVLTPIAAGTYTLDPISLKCEIVKGYERSRTEYVPFFRYFDFDSMFGTGRRAITENAFARSEPLTLGVKPLPKENQPPDFTGAVGQFDFKVTVDPQTVQTGEPVTVTAKVVGAGNFNEVELSPFPDLPAFKGYDPEVKVNTSKQGELVIGEKAFEKVLVGRLTGTHQIPALSFSFFDPQAGEYKTVTRGPFTVQVQPGIAQEEAAPTVPLKSEARPSRKEIQVVTQDIRYIKTDLGLIQKQGHPLYRMPLFWLLGFVPLPLLTGIGFALRKRQIRFQTDIGFARRTQALKKARQELETCARLFREGASDEFYVALSRALRQYLGDKLNRPAGGITVDIVEVLKERNLDRSLLEELRGCFERIDLAKFSAAKGNPQQMDELLKRLKQLVASLEKIL